MPPRLPASSPALNRILRSYRLLGLTTALAGTLPSAGAASSASSDASLNMSSTSPAHHSPIHNGLKAASSHTRRVNPSPRNAAGNNAASPIPATNPMPLHPIPSSI